MSATKNTAVKAPTDASPTDAPQEATTATETPQPETVAEVITREANEHAQWLVALRKATYDACDTYGICSGGRNAFLRDLGVPHNESSRRHDSTSQVAITVDPWQGLSPDDLTEAGQIKLRDSQRAKYAAIKGKTLRGIKRGADQGYLRLHDQFMTETISALGLDLSPVGNKVHMNVGSVRFHVPNGVDGSAVADAFGRVLSGALEMYLPGTYGQITVDKDSLSVHSEPDWGPSDPTETWTF